CLWVSVTQTQLFFLQQPAAVSASEQSSLLARSYGSGGKSDLDLLWKLHVRHGHRNFVDVARQYNLTLPSEIPACTSCIMGKSHVQPHPSNVRLDERKASIPTSAARSQFLLRRAISIC